MRNSLTIIASLILAAVCSRPLLSGLQHVVVPDGVLLTVSSPAESLVTMSLFTLFLCACAGLVATVACYRRRYSVLARLTIVLLPMLVAGGCFTLWKAAQFHDLDANAASFEMPVIFALREASFHMVPAVALAGGLLAVTISMFLRVEQRPQAGGASSGFAPATPPPAPSE